MKRFFFWFCNNKGFFKPDFGVMYFYPQPPVFESEVAQRLSTPGVAVGEFVVSICDSSIPCT